MNLVKKFLVASLILGSFSAYAKPNQEQIKTINQQIKEAQKKSNDYKQKSEQLKRDVNKLKFEKRLLVQQKQVDKMVSELEIAKPKKARKVLIYSRTNGFRHSSIETGVGMLEYIGKKTGAFDSVATEDVNMINDDELTKYDAIIMVNTTNNPIDTKEGRAAFENFLASKKGLVGIHAATDCHRNWPNYLEAMGGVFDGHPWGAGSHVTLHNEDPDHVC